MPFNGEGLIWILQVTKLSTLQFQLLKELFKFYLGKKANNFKFKPTGILEVKDQTLTWKHWVESRVPLNMSWTRITCATVNHLHWNFGLELGGSVLNQEVMLRLFQRAWKWITASLVLVLKHSFWHIWHYRQLQSGQWSPHCTISCDFYNTENRNKVHF